MTHRHGGGSRVGVRAGRITFARDVPKAWQPYYLGELETAFLDMQRVFPALSFAGLHVQFGNQPLPDSALAMHDPRTRTVELSIASSAGTIAHELSHDLDWQTSRRMYAHGHGYSTDRAMEDHRGALAESVRGLAEARVVRGIVGGGPSAPPVHDRPAELFARSVDWFVASTLALQGRSNGFLTAVQDPMLPGYAAGPPAALGSAGAQSLLGALAQMTFIPDSTRDAFEAEWSDAAFVDPTMMVRRVLDAPVSWRIVWQQVAHSAIPSPASMLGMPPAEVCAVADSPEAAGAEASARAGDRRARHRRGDPSFAILSVEHAFRVVAQRARYAAVARGRRRFSGRGAARRGCRRACDCPVGSGRRARRARDLPLQRRQLLGVDALTRLELADEANELVVARLVVGRVALDEGQRAAGLETARLHVGE